MNKANNPINQRLSQTQNTGNSRLFNDQNQGALCKHKQCPACLLRARKPSPCLGFCVPHHLLLRGPGPARNHLQIKSPQKCALPSAKDENLFSNKYLAGKGGERPRVTKGASGPGLFGLPGRRRGSGRAQLTTGTDRLISTWSCRNPIRGLRSAGQPRHVNLFSMCAARRSQTTGAQEARPQPQPQRAPPGELIKSLGRVRAARPRAAPSRAGPGWGWEGGAGRGGGGARRPGVAGRPRAGRTASAPGWSSAPRRRQEEGSGPRRFEHFKLIKIFADEYLFSQELGLAGDFPSNNKGCRIRFARRPSAVGLTECARPPGEGELLGAAGAASREAAFETFLQMALRTQPHVSPRTSGIV